MQECPLIPSTLLTPSAVTHIAVVDDETAITELLAHYLGTHGFRTTQLHSGRDLMALMPADPPELVLLDLGLPGEDGFAIARQLREHWRCGLVIITGRGDSVDKVVGLEVGADDYVPKPFDPRELVARVRSVLRRTAAAHRAELGAERVRIGRCVLDVPAHRLTDENGAEVTMSPLEFDLLKALAQHPNRPLSRERILNLQTRRDWDPFDRSVDLRVMRLRKKIEPDPEHPRFIRTVRNEGYVFVPEGR